MDAAASALDRPRQPRAPHLRPAVAAVWPTEYRGGMTTSPARLLPVLSALAGILLIAGCASSNAGSTAPSNSPSPSSSNADDSGDADMDGAILDDGRMFGVVTHGSSSSACVPQVGEVTADGQTVDVNLEDAAAADTVCTAD